MKKLFLIVAIVLAGCSGIGEQVEGENDFDLFAEYFQDCVEYCRADAEWSMACGGVYDCTSPEVTDLEACKEADQIGLLRCVRYAWDLGCSNYTCAERVKIIREVENPSQYCSSYDNREDLRLDLSLPNICN